MRSTTTTPTSRSCDHLVGNAGDDYIIGGDDVIAGTGEDDVI